MQKLKALARRSFSSAELILIVSLFVTLFANTAFFTSAAKIYPPDAQNILFDISLSVFITSVFIIALSVISHKFLIKPVLITFLLLSALIAGFMNQYGVIIDDKMIDNVLETNFAEARDLINLPLILYVIFLRILPSLFIYHEKISRSGRKAEWFSRLKLVGVSACMIGVIFFAFSVQYTSSFRMQRGLWAQVNPTHANSSAGKLVKTTIRSRSLPALIVGADAKIPESYTHKEQIGRAHV